MTKTELVAKLVADNATKTRKEMISMIMEHALMSHAAAQTYYYNAKKKLGASTTEKPKASKTKVAVVAPQVVEKTADEIAKIRAERLELMREIGARQKAEKRSNPFEVEAVDKFDEQEEEDKKYINSFIPNDFRVAFDEE